MLDCSNTGMRCRQQGSTPVQVTEIELSEETKVVTKAQILRINPKTRKAIGNICGLANTYEGRKIVT